MTKSFKKMFSKTLKDIPKTQLIGGRGELIQVDGTVICRERVIANPSTAYDEMKYAQWSVGGVLHKKGKSKDFFVCLVPNRKSETIHQVFKKFIHPDTIIMTDGHPSYPRAV